MNACFAVIGYNLESLEWFGIGFPPSGMCNSISKNTLDGVEYLVVSGKFQFLIEGVNITSLAIYNLLESSWSVNNTLPLLQQTSLLDALLDDTGKVYLSGYIEEFYNGTYFSVGVANFSDPSSLQPVGSNTLSASPYDLALYTDQNSTKYIFATGSFYFDYSLFPLAYALADPGGAWVAAGSNALFDYCIAHNTYQIIYADGGSGLNGIN